MATKQKTKDNEAKFEQGIQYVAIKDLKFAKYNPKKFSSKQFGRLSQSLEKFGWLMPVMVNLKTKNVVDGNQKLKWAYQKGDPEYKVPVLFVDVDLATEKKINIALNNTSTPVDAQMMFGLIQEFVDDPFIAQWQKDYEKLIKQAESSNYNPEYEIVKEVDEKHNYVVALFDKGVDFFNVETFFNLNKVYDYQKDRLLGLGRVIDGEKLLKLINLANKSGYKNINEIE